MLLRDQDIHYLGHDLQLRLRIDYVLELIFWTQSKTRGGFLIAEMNPGRAHMRLGSINWPEMALLSLESGCTPMLNLILA